MTVYPSALDDDRTIIRIDDNISELGAQAINQLRDAVFAIEKELGLAPAGTVGSLAGFLAVSHNPNGTIKASALTSVGLASLPIDDAQVGVNAGIKESKLALNHSTIDLYTQITANQALINSTAAFLQTANSDLFIHIAGGTILSDGSTKARHVGSQIDLNAVPSDTRDSSYIWGGLKDQDGNDRTATNVNEALDQINTSLITHQNLTTEAHPATAVSVDTSDFTEIPADATDVQAALDAIDDSDRLNIGDHRAVMHDNGVPRTARSQLIEGPDGYSQPIVPVTPCNAFLFRPPATSPVDNNAYGDDLIVFSPDNTNFTFDTQFTQVKVGDMLRINYGTGVEAIFPVESIRYEPGVSWVVRINGTNLENTDGYDAYARIDRPLFDDNTSGVFAVGAANHYLPTYPRTVLNASIMSSVIVADPRGATALGLGFDPNQLDSSHYLLYMNLYPTGTPSGRVIQMPGIDVTGNQGATPGRYTLADVVQATNDSLRSAGYNARFQAFSHKGNFGIMLTDVVDGASFSIINGAISGGTLSPGSFTSNVVADADTLTGYDALGLGRAKAGLASPDVGSYSAAEGAANYPTLIIPPLKNRNAIVNGVRRNAFIQTYGTEGDGYWLAEVTDVLDVGGITQEVEYTVQEDLRWAELKPGKTILVQPTLSYDDSSNQNQDYGRFVIKEVSVSACGPTSTTTIRVLNGVHWSSNPMAPVPSNGIEVRLYFGESSVSFNEAQVVDAVPTATTYNRFHEIYLEDRGKTFSHERVRMPHQPEDGILPAGTLDTQNNWVITDVSPKLRGFRDSDGSFRKYIRFYVLNYNTTTGEYDGYIGRRNPANYTITETGDIVRARKDVPARFYDATNIDYIELMYTEPGSSSTAIMSTNSPRFVDIEVFESLALDDEIFLLATCQLDDNTIELVTDRREFGTISEKNFSTSAISFIESGDRYLHANGVLRGLDYQGPDPSDSSLLNFNGGLALVNGHISVLNDSSVRIPEIRSGSPGQVVTWAVCVNDKDQFEPIIVTSVKDEFFVSNASTPYYVPSVTFTELVNDRKDLTPIAIVPVTISSLSLGVVTDIRKFVGAETLNLPLTLSQPMSRPNTSSADEGFVGNFSTLEQLVWWADNQLGGAAKVKVRGNVTISNPTSFSDVMIFDGDDSGTLTFEGTVDFGGSDITFRNMNVEFSGATTDWDSDGQLAAYNVQFTTDSTIKIYRNVVIRDCSFVYDPTSVGSADSDFINSSLGACLHCGNWSVARIIIDGCKFSSSTGNRPPFILVNRSGGSSVSSLNDVTINNCRFSDSVAEDHAAIVVEWQNTGTYPAEIRDVWITNNHCEDKQTIVFASRSIPGKGPQAENVHISNNRCAIIGYCATNIDEDSLSVTDRVGLTISGNSVRGILSPVVTDPTSNTVTGKHFEIVVPLPDFPTNDVYILNNQVQGPIAAEIGADRGDRTSLKIMGNTIMYDSASRNDQVFVDWGWDDAVAASGVGGLGGAITVVANNDDNTEHNRTSMIITGNRITSWNTSPGIGIATSSNGIISNNDIYGMATDTTNGRGIYCVFDRDSNMNITGNVIKKSGDIYSFIEIDAGATTPKGGVIADNFLSSWDPGTGNAEDAIIAPDAWIVERNKNHRVSVDVDIGAGAYSLVESASGNARIVGGDDTSTWTMSYNTAWDRNRTNIYVPAAVSDTVKFNRSIALSSIMPVGASLVSVSQAYVDNGDIPADTNQIGLWAGVGVSGTNAQQATNHAWGDEDSPITLDLDPFIVCTPAAFIFFWSLIREASAASITGSLSIMTITYQW
jgi:hypothetical protein